MIARRDFAFDSGVGEKLIDVSAPQMEGVNPFATLITMEDEKAGDPTDVGFSGPFRDLKRSSEPSN